MIVMRKRYEAQLQKEKKNTDNLIRDVLLWVFPLRFLICNSLRNIWNGTVSAQWYGQSSGLGAGRAVDTDIKEAINSLI